MPVQLPAGQRGTNWHWNSRYWLALGASWGGLITTAHDLTRFLHLFLNDGRSVDGRRVLSPATVSSMRLDWTSDLKDGFPSLGLSWLLGGHSRRPHRSMHSGEVSALEDNRTATSPDYVYDRRAFGDLLSTQALGHTGATGCSMWADPVLDVVAVVLTNSPQVLQGDLLGRIANMTAA